MIRRIIIKKESFKFAAAHMTLFDDGTKEALHGHNYTTELTLEFTPAAKAPMIPFSVLKAPLKAVCDAWDEKVLLPANSKFLKIKKRDVKETEFLLCGCRYVLPSNEIVFLPVDNVTAESLAEQVCKEYLKRFKKGFLEKAFRRVQVRVDESPGQGASYSLEIASRSR
jgi:6-pyruvoyltetrahydropterin/6-carboxytetrahydropterin synthase